MKLFAYALVFGAIALGAALYIHSPHLAHAIINPSYTPPYWATPPAS